MRELNKRPNPHRNKKRPNPQESKLVWNPSSNAEIRTPCPQKITKASTCMQGPVFVKNKEHIHHVLKLLPSGLPYEAENVEAGKEKSQTGGMRSQ